MIRRSLSALALMASLSACAAEPPAKPATAQAGPATEQAVRAAILQLAPGADVGKLAPAPVSGFNQLPVNGKLVYISTDGRFLIQGNLIDINNRENVTAVGEAALRKLKLDRLGPDRRIIFAAAQPRHRVTVFTDIDCGYCRKMHQQIADYNRLGISVEYLFYPRTGLGSESFDKAVAVWCAPDRRAAMTAAKGGQVLPKGNCSNPVAEDYKVGQEVGLDGTPAIYSADGTQLGGYLEPAEMLSRLEQVKAGAAR